MFSWIGTSVFNTKKKTSFSISLKNNPKLVVVTVTPFSDSAGPGPAFVLVIIKKNTCLTFNFSRSKRKLIYATYVVKYDCYIYFVAHERSVVA